MVRAAGMTSSDPLPEFIRTVFPSVWTLELLLLLRTQQGRALSRASMVAGLRGSELAVASAVQALVRAGLVTADPDGGARYAPATSTLNDLAAETEALYAERPAAVRRLIASAAG